MILIAGNIFDYEFGALPWPNFEIFFWQALDSLMRSQLKNDIVFSLWDPTFNEEWRKEDNYS